jgi:hypothetical protein
LPPILRAEWACEAFVQLLRRNPVRQPFSAPVVATFTVVGLVREGSCGSTCPPWRPASASSGSLITAGPIPEVLMWLLAIWAGLHLAGGLAPNPTGESEILYGMWLLDGALRYDQVVHGFGIGAATALFAYAARDTDRPLFWGFVLSQFVGLVNETAENIFAAFVAESNVGDIVNTTWDMIWHVIGAAVATLWMTRRGIPGPRRGEGYAPSRGEIER